MKKYKLNYCDGTCLLIEAGNQHLAINQALKTRREMPTSVLAWNHQVNNWGKVQVC